MTDRKDTQTYANDSATSSPTNTGLAQQSSRDVLPKGFTYFVQDGDMIKIGSSMRPEDRISNLQTGSSRPLETLAIVSMEVAEEFETHQRFAHLRVRGEWFRAEHELLDFIRAASAAQVGPAPEPKPAPIIRRAPASDPLVSQLHALRAAHGPKSAIGYRCSNLAEMVPAYRAATDPTQRAHLAASIQRQMADMARLRAGLQ